MTAAFLKDPAETWPAGGPFDLSVIDADADPAIPFLAGGAEVVIVGGNRTDENGRLVIPTAFATIDQARRAGAALAAAFSEVRKIQAEVVDPCYPHRHLVEARFTRKLNDSHIVCEACGKVWTCSA